MIITNVKANSRDKLPLDRLYDKIEAYLRALESLGLKSKENTAWLFPMVESCLTENVLKAWQRSSLLGQPEEKDQSRLTHLMKFLKAEVEGEERLKLARGGLSSINRKVVYHDKARGGGADSKFKFKKQASVPVTSFLLTKDHACIFCGKMHESKNCYTARELSVDERISNVKKKKCYLKCLEPNHIVKFCKQLVRCFACGKAHSVILCPGMGSKMESPLNRETSYQDVKCGDIPRVSKDSILKELKRNNIWLSDMGADCPKIDILIGSDNYGKILTGLVRQLKGGLTAVCTKLGWVVCGASDEIISNKDKNAPTLGASLVVHDFNISDLSSLEAIGILDPKQNLTNAAEEEIARDQFSNYLTRKENGRYCVRSPWL
ncbi:uncharacterized protein TNCT_554231 [Trichonephila clavata]|uniref:Peptidase aspartic putative domain-containing protein n=1 Tax=Trichonephila clavata TaxID=2740835 RepID=A0A8X6EZ69_TRICU|nr:uncharacterized protein TNCT_554231 [Trichonephila clavata]